MAEIPTGHVSTQCISIQGSLDQPITKKWCQPISKSHKCSLTNGLSPGPCQALIWANAGILLIRTLGTKFSEVLSELKIFIQENAFENGICKMASILPRPHCVNTLWPSDTIWRQRSGSTLAQEMACCLTAPGHYLNQYWLIISDVQWQSY